MGEGLIDRADAVGDPLRLGQELLGLGDGLFEAVERGIGQAREIARLVDQHGGLVLEALDFVVDLLQLARGGQDVLRIVGGIEDDPLRARRRACGGERQRGDACRKRGTKSKAVHGVGSWPGVSMSAAQSRPLARSQAAAKPSRPLAARRSAIAA